MHHKSDTQTFCRKRIIEFFDNSSEMPLKKDILSQPLLNNESKFYSPKNKNKELG